MATNTTLGPRELKRQYREARLQGAPPIPANRGRPKTRGDCLQGPRPCPWISCRYNLFLDVSSNGGLKFVHGEDSDPSEVQSESCALDVAAAGPHNREVIAELLHVTFERVRQIEVRGQDKMAKYLAERDVIPDNADPDHKPSANSHL